MKVFKLVWRHGKEDYLTGTDLTEACNKAGIGGGALSALDYWDEVSELPDSFKQFEIVDEGSEEIDIVYNPNFIEKMKLTGFKKGATTEINFGGRKFVFEYVGSSPTSYQYRRV